MILYSIIILCAIQFLGNSCQSLKFIDLPSDSDDPDLIIKETIVSTDSTTVSPLSSAYPPVKTSTVAITQGRRFLQIGRDGIRDDRPAEMQGTDDFYLKKKIALIIQQTIHDTTKKVASIQKIKERIRDQAPYKAGYILSLVRKSRLMLNDLFNLAVKHRDNWKALQQLKVFEYIVHTNVDTTNLVRQLVEVHIQHLNSTQSSKKRVVLL